MRLDVGQVRRQAISCAACAVGSGVAGRVYRPPSTAASAAGGDARERRWYDSGEDRAVAIERPTMTAEELLRLPDDGMRRELLDGELRTMAPAAGAHGRSGGWATRHLVRFIDEACHGEVFMAETGSQL